MSSFLEQLNPVQREAVQAVDGPVMIVAGAGSGKTRVLTYRTAYLLQEGAHPESVLALTFTNKAAGEMKARIEALVGPRSRAIWMGTFHSLFARILRVECQHLGYERSFTIYDRDDSIALVKSVMNDLSISQQAFSPQGILSRISGAKNQMVSPEAYAESASDTWTERAAGVYQQYERRLRDSNVMDFDDLLLKPLDLFRQRPDILRRYQERFTHLLVDEYQDTNRVQYRLITELARRHRNICVVGDDAQSIYGFRGADIRNILDFERDYPRCRVFRLEQNYRSTKTILAAAGAVIRNNKDQIPKDLWTENPEGEPITLTVCDDELDEGYRVVHHIEEEIRRNKLGLKDFAVLYRTNAQSRPVEDGLRRSGIPYTIVGGVAFYKRREIKDVLAYLKVLANPRDDESLLRIINVPSRGIGETTVGKVRSLATERGMSLLDATGAEGLSGTVGAKTVAALRSFQSLVRKYIALKTTMSVSELAAALVDELGVLRALKEENTTESLERRANVQELLAALTEFNETHPQSGLEEFLEEVSLVSDVDMAEFGRNAVTLMTLHSAKGLEYPVVFITGLEEGLFPLANALQDRMELEEERRLFYVGITRAMRTLFLSYAQTRYQYGERTYAVRSRFLEELPANLLSEAETARRPGTPYRRGVAGNAVRGGSRSAQTAQGGARSTPKETRAVRPSIPEFSDDTPRYEDESQIPVQVKVGTRVVHDAFGQGKIIAVDGRGENTRAVVEFETVGRKHLMVKFAHLRPA
jgi:DNA helicase II / ATP-dependent DNA helicase PcrA